MLGRSLVVLIAFISFLAQLTSCTDGQVRRHDLDVMLVLDASGSMNGHLSTLHTAAMNGFVGNLSDHAGGDRLGVVTFASGSRIAVPIDRTNQRGFSSVQVDSVIGSMVAVGYTVTGDAIRKSLDELRAVPTPSRSRVRILLVVTDGAPNMLRRKVVAKHSI